MALTLATTVPGEPEIFASLQGEGASAGRPCAFIRLSRCNLACAWCDTAYTWHFDGDNRVHRDRQTFDRAANQVSIDEAAAAAHIAALGQDRLVITGGEPLLQASALTRMLEALEPLRQMYVEIETNGTIAPPQALLRWVHQYNVSPKLAHSGNSRDLALRPNALAGFVDDRRAFFKFVVASPDDLDEVLTIQRDHAIPGARIFLMPEGRDSASLRARSAWLVGLCAKHGLSFTDRLHIHVYGDTRGT